MASLSSPPPLPPGAAAAAAALRRARRLSQIPAAVNPSQSPEPTRRSPWWAPLFRSVLGDVAGGGGGAAAAAAAEEEEEAAEREKGRLTAEKARALRREIRATEAWHDAMYHSAIASRLASPDDLEV